MTGRFHFAPWSAAQGPVPGAFRMGLRPITAADWLAAPTDLRERLAQRRVVLRDHLQQAWANPPPAQEAAAELLALLREHTRAHRTDTAAVATSSAAGPDGDPLLAAAALVPDDLCLLDPGDPPRLRAGVLTAPSGWRLDQRLGQDLRALHGPVDGLEPAIGERMRAFIDRLPPDRIFERGNWSLYDDDEYWRPEGAALGRVPDAVKSSPDVAEYLWLRREQQTLRRLRKSGWILFTIRVHLAPMTALADEPGLAADLRAAMASLTDRERHARRIDEVGAGLDAWLRTITAASAASAQPARSPGVASPARRRIDDRSCTR